MMVLLFEFVNMTCGLRQQPLDLPNGGSISSPGANGLPMALMPSPAAPASPSDQTPSEVLFESLVSAFRKSVMQTYKCRSVQFLLFFCCSYEPAYAKAFINLLLSQVHNEHEHQELRAASAAYAASFLARAKFLPMEEVLHWVKLMLAWATAYQQQALTRLNGQPPTLDVQLHGVFYAIIQGVLYVLCYKHELLLSNEAAASTQEISIALQPLLLGPLNPLKFCLDNVVCEFERLGLCDCAQVIAQNERLALGSRALGGGANRLEDFFPFDPIQLKRCAKLINPLFQTWVPPHGSSEPRDSNFTGTSLETGSECSPGASDSLARSLQAMSVTPLSGDELELQMRRRLNENRNMFQSMAAARAGA